MYQFVADPPPVRLFFPMVISRQCGFCKAQAEACAGCLARHLLRLLRLGHVSHLQAFIDRFRYNANRAALVQSRIKALERLAGARVAMLLGSICLVSTLPPGL